MKIKEAILSLSILFVLYGCQEDKFEYIDANKCEKSKVILTTDELLSIQYAESPELGTLEIVGLLKEFKKNRFVDQAVVTRSGNQETSFNIKKKYYLNDGGSVKTRNSEEKKELIPIYEINVLSEEGEGIAVVSADRRAPHVLAFVDRIDEKNDSLFAAPNALLDWAKACVENEIKTFETVRDSVYNEAITKIADQLKMDSQQISYKEVKDYITVGSVSTRAMPISEIPASLTVVSGTYPLCPVTWDQNQPYNSKLPKDNVDIFFGMTEYTNVPCGIANVALAHLFACLKPIGIYPGSIRSPQNPYDRPKWNILTQNPIIVAPDYFNQGDPLDIRDEVGNFFNSIYTHTGSTAQKNSSGAVIGTSTLLSKVESYMNYILDTDGKYSWDISRIKSSLSNAHPVFVYGRAENNNSICPFIIDGIMNCYGRISEVPRDINLTYLHSNFGFGEGYQDGWYLMELNNSSVIFETNIPLIFSSNNLTIIPNIREKIRNSIVQRPSRSGSSSRPRTSSGGASRR